MAMITCSECGSGVSSLAAACPKCGNPIAEAPVVKSTGTQITTVQATAKRFKMHKLFAAVMFFGGLFVMMGSAPGLGSTGMAIGSLLVVAGIVLYIVARARTWWHHG